MSAAPSGSNAFSCVQRPAYPAARISSRRRTAESSHHLRPQQTADSIGPSWQHSITCEVDSNVVACGLTWLTDRDLRGRMAALAINHRPVSTRTSSSPCTVRSRADVVEEGRGPMGIGIRRRANSVDSQRSDGNTARQPPLNRVVVRRVLSNAGLGVRAEHVSLHLERAVLLPLEYDKVLAGPRSRAS